MSAPGLRVSPAPRRIALLGVGTVGRALLARLATHPAPGLRLGWVANSRRWAGSVDGLDPAQALDALAQGEAHDGDGELPFALAAGDIVVDATASAGLAAWHPRWLRRGHRVVTANKLGNGKDMVDRLSRCKRRRQNPSVKRPDNLVAPE